MFRGLLGSFGGLVLAATLALTSPANAQTVEPPHAVEAPTAHYPEGAVGEATVIVIVTVDATGVVSDAVAQDDEPNEPFTSRAIETARTWRFDPALRDGKPVSARIRVEIVFRPPAPVVAEPAPAPSAKAPAPGAKPAVKAPVGDEEEVTVRGQRVDPGRTVSLSRTEVRQIPGVFGDPFRAIEIMPGVTPIVSGLPFFFIRGAPPGDVGYYLDGVRVPLLFHVGVGPSVVHPALISQVDLYPGGYPAQYGRFSGGIVSGQTAEPATEPHGEANLRLFDVGGLIETPFDDGKGSVLAAGRYSYTGALLTLLSSDTTLAYWDYQARATYNVTPNDRLGVFAFGSYDFLGQRTPTGTITLFGTEFHRIDLRLDHKVDENGSLRTAVTVGLDRSRLTDDRYTRDRLVGTRTELTYNMGPKMLLRAGTDMQLDSYDVELGSSQLSPSTASIASYFPTRTDLAMGIRGDVVLTLAKGFEVTPGVRMDFFESEGVTAVAIDPRLALKTAVSENVKLLTALGIAHQAPSFVVPVPGFQPGGLKGGLQEAVQESTGFEWDLGNATIATATLFHNAFYDMSDPLGSSDPQVSGCAPGAFPTDTIGGDRGGAVNSSNAGTCGVPRFAPGTVGPDRSGGGGNGADSNNSRMVASAFEVRSNGSAYGFELFIKRKLTKKIGGFLSYTLSRSVRTANNRDYVATFDRTHVANAALAYDLGRNWRAGTRVVFYTGLPKASTDTTDANAPSTERLAPFFRLDLRLEKRWPIGTKKAWLSFVAEWMNATLSKEEIATTCTLQGCQSQKIGPVTIPSLGLEGGF